MATKKKSPSKKSAKTQAARTVKKPAAKARAARKVASKKVDYYPNRMTFWVSAAAGSLIVLLAVIIIYCQ